MLSVGDILRREREKKGLAFKQIEKEIRVREKFLQAIEKNEWQLFSSKVYISGIIKNYSQFLGLDYKKMLAFFRREYERKEETGFKERVSRAYLTSDTKQIFFRGVVFIFIIVLIYFSYQIALYILPPKIIIVSPKETAFKHVDSVKISGKTEREAVITIFGDRIYQDKNGVFEYSFPLQKGKNELIIEVTGANGKKNISKKTFISE